MMGKIDYFSVLLMSAAVLLTACTPGKIPHVMDVRDISRAGGAPVIESIADLGNIVIPDRGPMAVVGPGQGNAVIGELLLVRGDNFGKQPRLTIGGRGTVVLAHVEGGGVVVRVPWGIDPGAVEVEVEHGRGRDSKKFPIRRLGLVATGDALQAFEVDSSGGVKLGQKLPMAGATRVTYSFDGAAAYVAGGVGKLWLKTVDMTGAVPRITSEDTFPGERVVDLVSAKQASLGAVISDTHMVVYDTSKSYDAALYSPHKIAWRLAKKGVLGAAMGGRGQTLALLLSDLNEVAVFDISDPTVLGQLTMAKLLPEQRLPVVQDLSYSPDGYSLWVASGDTARSVGGARVPARVTQLEVRPVTKQEPTVKLSVHRGWEMGQGIGPMELAVARGEPIPPGTAIRPEPSKSVVYISALPTDVVAEKAGRFFHAKGKGRVVRTSIEKEPQDVVLGQWLLTSQDVVGKTQVMVAVGCGKKEGKLRRVLVSVAAWVKDAPSRVTWLDEVDNKLLEKAPYWFGEVRAQP